LQLHCAIPFQYERDAHPISHHWCEESSFASQHKKKPLRTLNALRRKIRHYFGQSNQDQSKLEDLAFLSGQIAAIQMRGLPSLNVLSEAEFRVSSQWGEDGIIDWLIHHLGDMPETFIEFGVENYCESNTRFLLQHRNWRGLVIDGSEKNIEYIRQDRISWRHDLTAIASFITRENINAIISGGRLQGRARSIEH